MSLANRLEKLRFIIQEMELALFLAKMLMVTRKRGFLVMSRRELPDFKTTSCDGFGREVERGRVRRWSPRSRAS